MRTKRPIAIVSTLLIVILAISGVVYWNAGVDETRRIMLTTDHDCPAGSTEKIERAGEIGWLRLCTRNEIRHGPFAYWKKQRKYAAGTYIDGRLAGPVRYFREDGAVERIEEHPL
jgi:hypothetical protein